MTKLLSALSVKEESKYAYSFGVVKELERSLLTKDKFDRLIEAKDIDELFKLLIETAYSEATAENFESVLNKELKKVYLTLSKFAPDKQFIELFFLEYDFHNLKVLLKAKLQEKIGVEELFVELGEIGKEKMSAFLRLELSEIIKQLGDYSEIIQEIENKFAQIKDPRIIENILDRALFEKMYSYTNDNELLKEIVAIYADIANFKIAVRSKNLVRAKDLIVFVPHGKVSAKEAGTFYERGLEYFIKELTKYYEKIIPQALEYYEKWRSWLLLEKLADDYIIKKLRERSFYVGVEPLIGYLLAKKTEIKLLRMLIVGKLANLDIAKIKAQWRELYV